MSHELQPWILTLAHPPSIKCSVYEGNVVSVCFSGGKNVSFYGWQGNHGLLALQGLLLIPKRQTREISKSYTNQLLGFYGK